MSAPSDEAKMLPESFEPCDLDVICGWARQNHQHDGNKRFRDVIDQHAEQYVAAQTKLDKTQVIVAVIDKIRQDSPKGGFVKKDFYSGRWYEIGNEKARDKVGHAIRKASELLEKKKMGITPAPEKEKPVGRKRKVLEKKLTQRKKGARRKKEAPTPQGRSNKQPPPSSDHPTLSAEHPQHQPPLRRKNHSEGAQQHPQRPPFLPNNGPGSMTGAGGSSNVTVTAATTRYAESATPLPGRTYLRNSTPHAGLLGTPHDMILWNNPSTIATFPRLQSSTTRPSLLQNADLLRGSNNSGNRFIDAAAGNLLRDEMALRSNVAMFPTSLSTATRSGAASAQSGMARPPYSLGGLDPLAGTLPPVGLGASVAQDLATLRYLEMTRPFLPAFAAGGRRDQHQVLDSLGGSVGPSTDQRQAYQRSMTLGPAQSPDDIYSASRDAGSADPEDVYSAPSKPPLGEEDND